MFDMRFWRGLVAWLQALPVDVCVAYPPQEDCNVIAAYLDMRDAAPRGETPWRVSPEERSAENEQTGERYYLTEMAVSVLFTCYQFGQEMTAGQALQVVSAALVRQV